MKLFFVYGASTSEVQIEHDVNRLEVKDLIIAYRREHPTHLLNKIDVLVMNLDSKMDYLIGQPISSREEYSEFKKKLLNKKIEIVKFFIKPIDTYTEYKKQHDIVSSHWLDYHPDYVKEQDRLVNEELKKLAKVLEADGVEVEFIK